MAKTKQKIDIRQTSLFDLIREVEERQAPSCAEDETPGRLDIDATLRELITRSLKASALSRYEVAAKMSLLLGREITKSQLDSWSAESKDGHRFPLAYLPAFVAATGDREIVALLCRKANGHFIEGTDAIRLELGRIEEQKKDLQRKERAIREFLGSLSKDGGV